MEIKIDENNNIVNEPDNKEAAINKLALRFGLIIGVVYVVISSTLHFINPMLMYEHLFLSTALQLVCLGIVIYGGINIRNEVGGYWKFGDAFRAFLVMALIISLVTTLYGVILMKFVDPDLPRKAAIVMEQKQRSVMSSFGLSAEQIDDEIAKMGDLEAKITPTKENVVVGFGTTLALYALGSLILAAILKKNRPLFEPEIKA